MTIARHLAAKYAKKSPSFSELESTLSGFTHYDQAQWIYLIGWIKEGEHFHCFRWNSLFPHMLFTADDQISGSGEMPFEGIRQAKRLYGHDDIDDIDLLKRGAISIAAGLVLEDCTSGSMLLNRSGYFYDIIYWDGRRFRYIDPITVVPMSLQELTEGNPVSDVPFPIFHSRTIKQHLVVQIMHPNNNIFIDTIGDTNSAPKIERALRVDAPYVAWPLVYKLANGGQARAVIVNSGPTKFGAVTYEGQRMIATLNTKEVKEMIYAGIRAVEAQRDATHDTL